VVCGDYGSVLDGRLVAAVQRKAMPDLVASLASGKLGYALADLSALPARPWFYHRHEPLTAQSRPSRCTGSRDSVPTAAK
jgi:hypothetical protein